MSDAPKDLTAERLAELRSQHQAWADYYAQLAGNPFPDVLRHRDHVSLFDELQRRRASDRWIPWKSGDALPEGQDASLRWHQYWITVGPGYYGELFTTTSDIRAFEGRGVRAYWSRPLPPPFDSSIAASKEGE
jgi:hypothetical protein